MLTARRQLFCLIVGGAMISGNDSGCGFPRPVDVPGDGSQGGPGLDAAASDASSNARCNPSKPFEAPTVLTALNSSFDEVSFTLSRDELTAFIGRVNTGNPVSTISVAVRGSVTQAFGAAAVTPAVAAINGADGDEESPSSTGDTLVLYFHRQDILANSIDIFAAQRVDPQGAFDAGSFVSVGGAGLTDALTPVISFDGQTLYWLDFQQFYLHAAPRRDTPRIFGSGMLASTMPTFHPTISRDNLTLYYSDSNDANILVSTRTSIFEPFGTGVPVANVNSPQQDAPVYLTEDDCILYLTSTRPGGAGGFDLWEAHRPL